MSRRRTVQFERALLVDDDELSRTFLQEALQHLGLAVTTVASGRAALAALELAAEPVDLVLTDLKMPGVDGLQVLAAAKALQPQRPVVLVTAHGTVGVAVEAMRRGADDVLEKPVAVERIELLLLRLDERQRLLRENQRLRAEHAPVVEPLATSPIMRELLAQVDRIAQSDLPVLITGESGTGKEVIASRLHRSSQRATGPEVKLNCAAIPQELVASEFFGHERGAFTGAERRRVGCFERADGGSLFLD
jgi:DNA-binding NtrC family response regulator